VNTQNNGFHIEAWPQLSWNRNQYYDKIKKWWIAAEPTYEHGWLYVVQSMRSGGWILSNERFIAFLSKRDGWRELPAVITVIGDIKTSDYQALCEYILQFLKSDILVIRNIRKDLVPYIIRTDSRFSVNDDEQLPIDCKPEERFPSVTVELQRLRSDLEELPRRNFDIKLHNFDLPIKKDGHDFRESVRRGAREIIKQHGLVREWKKGDLGSMLNCIRINANWHVERVMRQGGRVQNGWKGFYQPVFEIVSKAYGVCEGLVVEVDHRIEAFLVWDYISEKFAGVYALASTPLINCSMDVLLATAYTLLRRKGYTYLGLGGSEITSLYSFKMKVGVCQTRDLVQLFYSK